MTNWKYTLNISKIWHDDDLDIQEKADYIRKTIQRMFSTNLDFESENYDEDLDIVVENLADLSSYDEDLSDVDSFDEIWDAFYDWADFNRVWVKTS